jgi:hypothetical protein
MTPIETIALVLVSLVYTASQQLLNWWGRVELKEPSFASLWGLVIFLFMITNILFYTFIIYMIELI